MILAVTEEKGLDSHIKKRELPYIPNPFQANDWKMGRFLSLVLTLQAIVLLLIFLDGQGLSPPPLRQLATFLFYSYVPGLVLLRVLRIHRLGSVLTTIASVGASLTMMMFVGLGLNTYYVIFAGPIPLQPSAILSVQTIVLIILCTLAYMIDRSFGEEPVLDISPFISAPAFVLYSLPLVAVLATHLLNGWNVAVLQVLLILLIAAIILTFLSASLPSQLYPVAVVFIALAVLLHTSLVSRFLIEWADLSFEYWVANDVLLRGYWDLDIQDRVGTTLSITILAPSYSLLCGLDLVSVFKICYPALLALVPLGAYVITKPVLGERESLLAAFLIISAPVFFTEMLGLSRQMVAELLLVTILLIFTNRTNVSGHISALAWFLVLGMIVSHYGTVFIAGPCLLASGAIYIIWRRERIDRRTVAKMAGFITFLIVPALAWYGLLADSFMLIRFQNLFLELIRGIFTIPVSSGNMAQIVPPHMVITFQDVLKAFYWVLILLLSAYGSYAAMRHRGSRKWDDRYLALALPFIALSFLTLFDSKLFTEVSKDRLFHICLIFTAPLATYGGLCAFRKIKRKLIARYSSTHPQRDSTIAFGSILVVGFLLSTGLFAFVTGDPLPIELDTSAEGRACYSDGEYVAANFTVDKRGDSRCVYADAHRAYLMEVVGGLYDPLQGRTSVPVHGEADLHYFLGTENLEGRIWLEDPQKWRENKTCINIDDNFKRSLLVMDKVYASQEAELYYKKFWGPI